jgi:hypothetical protein
LCNLSHDFVGPSASCQHCQRNPGLGCGPRAQPRRLPFIFRNDKWGVHSDNRAGKYDRNSGVKSSNRKNILFCGNGVQYRFCRKRAIKRSLLSTLHFQSNPDTNADSQPNAGTHTYSDAEADPDPDSNSNSYTGSARKADANSKSNSQSNAKASSQTARLTRAFVRAPAIVDLIK